MKKIFFILLALVSSVVWCQNNALFEQGKEHYKNGKFQEAINAWEKVLDNGKHSASLYFNLGNANYKLNNIGPSIYYYEKALQLAPADSDIKTNLKFAENTRIDAIEPLPKTILKRWYEQLAGALTYDGWAVTSVVGAILFVLLFLSYWFSASETKKRLFFITSVVSILVLLVGLVMAYQTYGDVLQDTPAIVFSESTQVKSEPNMGSETAFILHEGTKVQITATEDKWIRVLLANGKDGWIPASDVKRL
ncbi:tetratricopeptide repeat protein [Marinirhabdus gelatinilytica]|uniref:SH3 domain-containing protein n=1 Tax=Marinirhabdus gelatinilytica TaxID=1703343 RepID=A0A370QJY0_9FLAO|nr:tetratricopeptide repeat protein [Marinirhabdus gelatinilytica]RDK88636.1 SH3 domain-containing protein [Marinirhabdus gelatinilytica]